MRERGDRLGLPLEPAQCVRVARQVRSDRFDSHVSLETRVASPINLSHSAGADERAQLVRAEPGPR
jgi:hypothetical protein